MRAIAGGIGLALVGALAFGLSLSGPLAAAGTGTAGDGAAGDGATETDATNGRCAAADLAPLRRCSDRRAQAIAGAPAWEACEGRCIIRQNGADAVLMDAQGRVIATLAGLTFLLGAGRTSCLSGLPFLTANSDLVVLDGAGAVAAGPSDSPPAEIARLSLAPLYETAPHDDPVLHEAMTATARLSCDGARFFSPLQDGIGFSVERITPSGTTADAPEPVTGTVIFASPTGRYGLEIGEGGAGGYILRDFVTGTSTETAARPELDVPFFDVSERYLLIRMAPPAGQPAEPDTPMEITITDLATLRRVGAEKHPPSAGLAFRVLPPETGQPEGLRLVPVAQDALPQDDPAD